MKAVKLIIQWLIYIGAAAVIVRAITLVSGFDIYLTDNPWDWLMLALVLSPAIPLVLYIFWGKSQKTMLGEISPAKQIIGSWWMVSGKDSSITRILGRNRPIWQMILWVIFWLFIMCVVGILGMIFIPRFEDFMSAYVR